MLGTVLGSASADGAASDLALGLQTFYWGMSPQEATKIDPGLGDVPVPNPGRAEVINMSRPFEYAGCKGTLSLHFYNEHLNNIRFEQVRDSSPCREQVLRELQEKFGTANERFPGLRREESLEMRGRTTVAEYMHWRTESVPGSAVNFAGDWMIVNMRELFDTSGERFAALMSGETLRRATSCQSVRAEFIPDPSANSLAPAVTPVGDLNCEYPVLAVGRFSHGRVVLQINILADGTLANGVLVVEHPPDMYAADLTDAAIRIASEKLRYKPAMKNGAPVATQEQLEIDFNIVRPLRGRP